MPKIGSAAATLIFIGLFAWMLTRPFENFSGDPDGGPLEVHFGTPLSNSIYTYWPETGNEALDVSKGMWDGFRLGVSDLWGREVPIDTGEYRIKGQKITGQVFWRDRQKDETVLDIGVLIKELPARAEKALEDGRSRIRARWPEKFHKVVSTSGH